MDTVANVTTQTETTETTYRVTLDITCPVCGYPEMSGQLPGGPGPRIKCNMCYWRSDVETATDTVREAIAARLIPVLAGQAECERPDSHSSPGAELLNFVRRGVLDATQGMDESAVREWLDDCGHEIYDNAGAVYTAEIWRQFVDLGAWGQDSQDEPLCDTGMDVTNQAAEALRRIAERLTYHLAEEIAEALGDDEATRTYGGATP